jgi:glutaredoxin
MTDAVPIAADGSPTGDGITVYGATWCGDTKRSRAVLDRLGLPYAFVDVDRSEPASAWVMAQNGGNRSLPTIRVGRGGPTVTEPSDDELLETLREAGLAPANA